jgi:hypothetical protein
MKSRKHRSKGSGLLKETSTNANVFLSREVPGVRSHGKPPGKLLVPEGVRVFAERCKRYFDNADHRG